MAKDFKTAEEIEVGERVRPTYPIPGVTAPMETFVVTGSDACHYFIAADHFDVVARVPRKCVRLLSADYPGN